MSRTRLTSSFLALVFFLSGTLVTSLNHAWGQPTGQVPAGEILLGIEKLATTTSVLYIAAHPDDENTRLLSYLARERKARTAYLSITRGDGGQNLVGKEQGDLLGLIRTQELLAARRVDGAEQYFTRACDFGYSKNPEETFRIWNKDSILSDVVWVIRKFRPDIIICRFPTTGEGGHGHHTASALLAEEAFAAAADPRRFSWQLEYTGTWQTRRLFWNTFNFGGENTTSPDQLKLDVGIYNPLLGKSYGEIAAESRSNHKSQGFGSARLRGSVTEYFKQLKGDSVQKDILEGIPSDWSRIVGGEGIRDEISGCQREFDVRNPSASLNRLKKIHRLIGQLNLPEMKGTTWKEVKLQEAENLLLACSGVWMEAYSNDPVAVPGEKCQLSVQLVNRGNRTCSIDTIRYPDGDTALSAILPTNQLNTFNHLFKTPDGTGFSDPYWLRLTHTTGIFSVSDVLDIGNPENSDQFTVTFSMIIDGYPLKIKRTICHKSTDPVRGELYRPLELLPALTVTPEERNAIFTNNENGKLRVTVRAQRDSIRGRIALLTEGGWMATTDKQDIFLASKGDELSFIVQVTPGPSQESLLRLSVIVANDTFDRGIRRIEYDHIPPGFLLFPAQVRLTNIALKRGGRSIGYIPGAGDELPACLQRAGYSVTVLDPQQLTGTDLSTFDAVVTGVRVYNTEKSMQQHHNRMMEYVRNGGNLVVQYNTNNRIGPVVAKIGPYPFTISRDRVTDENAEVRFLLPEHPALNQPNRITSADFDNWIQERGIYFASERDSSYVAPLSMNDPSEKPKDGSVIICQYGKGNFVYTGLAFFRQLPAGTPGAYRLLSNLLALPENK